MNINPLDFNYIDGLNTYPIQDYIDASITSNITSNIITCNINIGGNQTLNNSLYYLNSNLYLNNNAPFGNTYFKTSYNYPNSNNIGVKIDFSGKLQVYHNYNLLQPTLGEGYYDVESEILQLKADGINTDVQLTALEAGAIYLQTEIDDLLVAINLLEVQLNSLIQNIYFSDTYNQLRNVTLLTDYSQYAAQYATLTNNIATQANAAYVNSFTIGAATAVGFGIAGAALSATASYFYYQRASNAVFSNVNFSNAQKTIVYNNNSNKEITTYNNYYTSSCNLSINQGFINSNITTQQLIPKLKSNEITLNNKAITKFSLDNLDDWIKTTNGIYYDITNGTLAINSTPTITDFFRVGGQTTIQGDIICETKLKVNNANLAIPAIGINGGIGDKLILRAGTASIHPYSLGLTSNNLWYSVPSAASHSFYVNGSPITTISSTGLSTTGIINATTNLQENSVNLTSKYLQLSGGTMSGNLGIGTSSTIVFTDRILNDLITLYTGYGFGINASTLRYNAPIAASHIFYVNNAAITTISSTGLSTTGIINATTNLQENGTNLTSKYLQLSGGTMSGTLTLSTTSGNNPLYISSTNSSANNCINIKNNSTFNAYIGVGGTAFGNNYQNNLFIESAASSIILNTNGRTSASTPNFIVHSSGNIGINTTSPNCLLSINKVDYKILSFFDNGLNNSFQFVGLGANSGLCFNNFASGDNFQFRVGTSATTANEVARITSSGDFSCSGTTITIGNSTAATTLFLTDIATAAWKIETGNTNLNFNNNNGGTFTNKMLLTNAGNLIVTSRIGIGITNPFEMLCIGTPAATSDGTLVISRNNVGGGNRNFKIGIDANFNFCIGDYGNGVSGNTWRPTDFNINWNSANVGIGIAANSISQKLYVNGTSYLNGDITSSGSLNISSANQSLNLGQRIQDNLIKLWTDGTNTYGLGINNGTLRYNVPSGSVHRFYNGATNTITIENNGSISGGINVCKRVIFSFTPSGVIVGGGFRYTYIINLSNYISLLAGPIGNMYIFRIHIWTTSGDFGDSVNNVESMTYLVYLADFGGNPKIRTYALANSSNGSYISVSTSNTIYYNGWNGTGGASSKYCVIENISSY